MAAYLGEDQIEKVRNASDIVEVIREYVPLKRAGKDFKALCPFHNEKTPSFQVSPTKQIFKCFGCGKGGNVFTFVMAQERLEFPEAVEFLARRAGIELTRTVEHRVRSRRRDSLFEMNLWAAKVFHRCLMNADKGAPGRDYFDSRRMEVDSREKFRLGYAPEGWDFLLGLAAGKGYEPKDLEDAGLVVPRSESGWYDRFRNRIIFPIFDVRGRVVGFGGRALDDSTPKYLNSPETSVFNKSACLYGLNAAKEGILRENKVVVVEGYTDCLMAHQHGIDWVVATLGTALTADHVRTLRRYTEEVVLVFDGDSAGRAAAERSVDLFLAQDVDVRVVLLPGGSDPCDMLVSEGSDAFLKRLEESVDVFDLKMEMIAERHDLSRVRGKESAIEEILDTLARTGSSLRLDMVLQNKVLGRLCQKMGVTEASLRSKLAGLVKRKQGRGTVQETPVPVSRLAAAARELVGCVLSDPSLAERFCEEVGADEFADESLAKIAQAIRTTFERGPLEVSGVCDHLGDEKLMGMVVDVYNDSQERGEEPARFDAALRTLSDDTRKREMQELKTQLADATASGDEKKVVELLGRHNELMKR